MGKITITLALSDEKLEALHRYLAKKDETLDEKLCEQVLKLYATTLPAAVREYLDDKDGTVSQDSCEQKVKAPAKRRERDKTMPTPADTVPPSVTQ